MTRPVLRVVRTADEEARRDNVMAALAELARKYDTHRACHWYSIKLGALDELMDAYRGVQP